MPFWTMLFRSFIDLTCYRDRITEPLRALIRYMVQFYLLLLVVTSTLGFFGGKIFADTIVSQISQDTQFTLSPEYISATNIELPLTLTLPFFLRATIQADTLEFVLPNQHSLRVPIKDLMNDETYTFTGNDVKESLPSLLPTALMMTAMMFVGVLFIGRIVSLFFHAIFFSWIVQLFGRRVHFWKLVQLGMHITVTAEVVTVLSLFIYRSTAFPMFEVAFTLLMVLVLRSLQQPSEQNG
ncbi:MAG: hypothetical protein HZA34_00440 [Candidatus Pacebacteria bacterium]|nr:hypothetical protein [Candidatus Paceibacterota bacterium]